MFSKEVAEESPFWPFVTATYFPAEMAIYLMKAKTLYLLLIVFCSHVKAENLFCEKFIQFAESANDTHPISILLISDWSSFSISCSHNQQVSEMQFCERLVQNSSKENMKLNVTNVENCLKDSNNQISFFQYTDIVANYSVSEVPNIAKNSEVTVSYSYGNRISKPYLKLIVLRSNE
jgi:hypothetical protein